MRMFPDSLSDYFHFCVRLRWGWRTEIDSCGTYVTVQTNLCKGKTVQQKDLSLIRQLFISQVHVSPGDYKTIKTPVPLKRLMV